MKDIERSGAFSETMKRAKPDGFGGGETKWEEEKKNVRFQRGKTRHRLITEKLKWVQGNCALWW